MPSTIRTALTLVPLTLALSSAAEARQGVLQADVTAAEDPSLEKLLDAKGLYRFGNTYILIDTGERDARLAGLARELAAVEEQFAPLYAERDRLRRAVSDARSMNTTYPHKDRDRMILRENKAVALAEARNALAAFESRNGETVREVEKAKAALADRIRQLVAETRNRYETIAADPQVKRVVRAYNREHRPKIVLGPVASHAEYRATVLRDDAALLREKGMVLEKGHRWVVEPESRVGPLAALAHHDLIQLAAVEAAVEAGTPPKLREKRKAVAERLANAPEPVRRQLAAEVELLDTQIRRHSAREPGMAAAWRESANRLAAARGKFLAAMAELRSAADSSQAARRRLEADEEALDTLEEVAGAAAPRPAKRTHHVAEALEYRHGLAELAWLETAIRVERVRMDRGPAGPGLVAVTLNGSHPVKAEVDPAAATTRLPSSLAALLDATPGAGAEAVDVLTPGGRTVRGHVSVLRSVAIGPVTIGHVPCVVLPDDAPGPASPALGADLLAMIGGETDADGNDLVITRVVLPPRRGATAPTLPTPRATGESATTGAPP